MANRQGILALALLSPALLACTSVRETENAFAVAASQPAFYDDLRGGLAGVHSARKDVGFLVTAHRIEAGPGVTMGYRYYHDVRPTVDEEVMEKITVYVPYQIPSHGVTLHFAEGVGSNDGMAYRSVAGVAWADYGCLGFAREGTVRIARNGAGEYVVDFDVWFDHVIARQSATPGDTFDLAWWEPSQDKCQQYHLQRRVIAVEKNVDALSRWEGRGAGPANSRDWRDLP